MFQFCSDLHLEFYITANISIPSDIIVPTAPYLFLIGDIGTVDNTCRNKYKKWLYHISNQFKHVYYIAGNHEYYNSGLTFNDTKKLFESISYDSGGKITFLDRKKVIINDIVILGCSLWTRIPKYAEHAISDSLNDYRLTIPDKEYCNGLNYQQLDGDSRRKCVLNQLNDEHEKDLEFLTNEILLASQNKQICIVLTHHNPTFLATSSRRYGNPLHNIHNFGFSNSLEYFFKSFNTHHQIQNPNSTLVAWLCGHSHYNANIEIFETRVISNQRGYKDKTMTNYCNNMYITFDSDNNIRLYGNNKEIAPRTVIGVNTINTPQKTATMNTQAVPFAPAITNVSAINNGLSVPAQSPTASVTPTIITTPAISTPQINQPPTIFDKVVSKEVPSTILYEDELCIAFKDKKPVGPIHFLVVPKSKDGLNRLSDAREDQKDLLGHLLYTAQKVAKAQGLKDRGFRTTINDGPNGGQFIDHLHIHVVGGRQMAWYYSL